MGFHRPTTSALCWWVCHTSSGLSWGRETEEEEEEACSFFRGYIRSSTSQLTSSTVAVGSLTTSQRELLRWREYHFLHNCHISNF